MQVKKQSCAKNLAVNHPPIGRCSLILKKGWRLMRRPKYGDEVVRKLCADAIAAEGEEFQAAIAKLRDYIQHSSHNLENATLASVLKVSKVIQTSRKEAAREDDEEPQKRAA